MEKNKKKTIILVAILCLIIGGLIGYIVGDKMMEKEQKLENNNNVSNASNKNNNNTDDNTDNKVNNNNNSDSNDDIYDHLLNGDFSGVAGEYVNTQGNVIKLLDSGLIEGHEGKFVKAWKVTDNTLLGNGSYAWDMGQGSASVIVPIGVSLKNNSQNISSIDDTSKIRFTHGNGIPGPEDIYFKK